MIKKIWTKKKIKKTEQKQILLQLLMSSQLGRLNTNSCSQDLYLNLILSLWSQNIKHPSNINHRGIQNENMCAVCAGMEKFTDYPYRILLKEYWEDFNNQQHLSLLVMNNYYEETKYLKKKCKITMWETKNERKKQNNKNHY